MFLIGGNFYPNSSGLARWGPMGMGTEPGQPSSFLGRGVRAGQAIERTLF